MKHQRQTSQSLEAANRKSLGWAKALGHAGDVNARAVKRAARLAAIEARIATIPPSKPYPHPRKARATS